MNSQKSTGSILAIAGGLLALGGLVRVGRKRRQVRLQQSTDYTPHVLNAQHFVPVDPNQLAMERGVSLDHYVLASVMQSEDSSSDKSMLGIGLAVVNQARKKKLPIAKVVLSSKLHGIYQPSHGYLASQEAPGRAMSTSKAPEPRALALAEAILARRVPDFTQGATKWDAPRAIDRGHAKNPKKYTKTAAQVAEDRKAGGAIEVNIPGIKYTRFWRYS